VSAAQAFLATSAPTREDALRKLADALEVQAQAIRALADATPPETPPQPSLGPGLNLTAASKYLGISLGTLARAIDRGDLAPERYGPRTSRLSVAALDAYRGRRA
jgi:excisionase family DNA binding protein